MEVAANSFYEAIARGPHIFRTHDSAADIACPRITVTVIARRFDKNEGTTAGLLYVDCDAVQAMPRRELIRLRKQSGIAQPARMPTRSR